MKINPRVLRGHPLLSLIPTYRLRNLLSESSLAEYPKGTVVFREGDSCDALYLIISGRCEARHRVGEQEEVEEVFGPGDTLGERELLNQELYRSTVKVVTHCVLLRLSGEELQRLFEQNPALAGRFSRKVSNRSRIRREDRSPQRARRIVSMMSLSSRLHERAVAQRIATSLYAGTKGRVLLVHLVPYKDKVSLKDWARIAPKIDGEFCFAEQAHRGPYGYHELGIEVTGDESEAGSVAPLLSHMGRHFDYVLLHIKSEIAVPSAIECMIQSDLTYVFLQPTPENLYEFGLLLREVCTKTKGDCSHVKPVLCVGEQVAATDFSDTLNRLGYPVHSFVRGFPLAGSSGAMDRPGNFALHTNRLAREIARRRIGLALSSGGAKGLAHIGVLQVLEENGIEVDVVAGSSMGAYVGAVWTFGHDGATTEKIAREIESRWGLLKVMDPALPPRQGFLHTGRAIRRLHRSIGHAHFSDLVVPLRVVTTRLDTLERVVFSNGEVATAVEASIAIPGICVPVTIDGETYIDGGIADPLPVDVLVEMGIERIVAVNTIPTPERLRYCVEADREFTAQRHSSLSFKGFLNKHINYFARGNVLDTMLRSVHGAQTRVAERACREADIVLRPWSCDLRWHDFTHPGKYIALGRKAAENQLSELKALAHVKADEKTSTTHLAVAP